MIAKFKQAISASNTIEALANATLVIIRNGEKAAFALDLLASDVEPREEDSVDKLKIPEYIRQGLSWLEQQLIRKQREILTSSSELQSPEVTP